MLNKNIKIFFFLMHPYNESLKNNLFCNDIIRRYNLYVILCIKSQTPKCTRSNKILKTLIKVYTHFKTEMNSFSIQYTTCFLYSYTTSIVFCLKRKL